VFDEFVLRKYMMKSGWQQWKEYVEWSLH